MAAAFDARVQRACALSGAVAMVVALSSQVAVLPWGQQGWVYGQPSFGAPASVWAAFYRVNHVGIMVGTGGFELAWAILLFWSIQYALMLWRLDDGTGFRVLVGGIAAAALTIPFLMMVVTAFWTVAGFRADIDPEITRAFSDLGYLGSFLWFYTALITMVGGGWLMLRFRGRPAAFAPWLGWAGVLGGATQLPAVASQFVMTGAFSLNGGWGWYLPLGGWFVWMMLLSPAMYGMTRRPDVAVRAPDGRIGAATG